MRRYTISMALLATILLGSSFKELSSRISKAKPVRDSNCRQLLDNEMLKIVGGQLTTYVCENTCVDECYVPWTLPAYCGGMQTCTESDYTSRSSCFDGDGDLLTIAQGQSPQSCSSTGNGTVCAQGNKNVSLQCTITFVCTCSYQSGGMYYCVSGFQLEPFEDSITCCTVPYAGCGGTTCP